MYQSSPPANRSAGGEKKTETQPRQGRQAGVVPRDYGRLPRIQKQDRAAPLAREQANLQCSRNQRKRTHRTISSLSPYKAPIILRDVIFQTFPCNPASAMVARHTSTSTSTPDTSSGSCRFNLDPCVEFFSFHFSPMSSATGTSTRTVLEHLLPTVWKVV